MGPNMIPIKTIVIEQVRRDISSVKEAYVKLACNRVISPGMWVGWNGNPDFYVWLFIFTMLLRMLV